MLLGADAAQAANAFSELQSSAFQGCFEVLSSGICLHEGSNCIVNSLQVSPVPHIGDAAFTMHVSAQVSTSSSSSDFVDNEEDYTVIRVGSSLGLLADAQYGGGAFPQPAVEHLAQLLASRMTGLPPGLGLPSAPLPSGQSPKSAMTWTNSSQALPAGGVGVWDYSTNSLLAYVAPNGGQRGATEALTASGWTRLSPLHPPQVTAEAIGYDQTNGQAVLLGTFAGAQQTWLWNGSDWSKYGGASPPYRTNTSEAFDASSGRLVLFGGSNQQGGDLGDTWTWDGRGWQELTTSPGPLPRGHAALAYSPGENGLVLFGGDTTTGTMYTDTWLLAGDSWTKAPTKSTPPGGVYWMVTLPEAGVALLLGWTSGGRWEQWSFDSTTTNWEPTVSPGTPTVMNLWPVVEPLGNSYDALYVLPQDSEEAGDGWVGIYHSLAAEPTTACPVVDIQNEPTNGFQLLVVGSDQETDVDESENSDNTWDVEYRNRDAVWSRDQPRAGCGRRITRRKSLLEERLRPRFGIPLLGVPRPHRSRLRFHQSSQFGAAA